MKRSEIRKSFKKVVLTFEIGRTFRNFMKLFVSGILSSIVVLSIYLFTKNQSLLLFLILPATIFITSLEFYRRSKKSENNLKDIHNKEITDELKKFDSERFNRESKH